jgi:hypothetical protein
MTSESGVANSSTSGHFCDVSATNIHIPYRNIWRCNFLTYAEHSLEITINLAEKTGHRYSVLHRGLAGWAEIDNLDEKPWENLQSSIPQTRHCTIFKVYRMTIVKESLLQQIKIEILPQPSKNALESASHYSNISAHYS